jgi:hypothetical protein
MSEPSFTELVERLESDDHSAVGLLIERYGNALRRAIERSLSVRRLGRGTAGFDPAGGEASDVFQTVLLLFLARLRRHRDGTSGTLRFETPAHLVAYLKAIAEHEMVRRRSQARLLATSRGGQKHESPVIERVSSEPTPSQCLLAREILERDQAALAEVTRRMSTSERAIWDMVRQELSWPEIARCLGGAASPEAVRKAFARAVRRIAEELKTGDHDYDQAAGRR